MTLDTPGFWNGSLDYSANRESDKGWSLNENWTYGHSGGELTFNLSGSGSNWENKLTINGYSGASGNESVQAEIGNQSSLRTNHEWSYNFDDGFDYSATTSGSGHLWGTLDYSNSGSNSYAASTWGNDNWFLQDLHEEYDTQTYTSGGRTIDADGDRSWSSFSGTITAYGHAHGLEGYSTWTGYTSGSGTYSSQEWSQSEANDYYDLTGSWLDTVDEDGTLTISGQVTNHRWGDYHASGFYIWQVPWDSWSSSNASSGSYYETVNDLGFHDPTYTGVESWRPALGIGQGFLGQTTNGYYVFQQPGNSGAGSSSSSSSDGGASTNDPANPGSDVPEWGNTEFSVQTPNRVSEALADWTALTPTVNPSTVSPPPDASDSAWTDFWIWVGFDPDDGQRTAAEELLSEQFDFSAILSDPLGPYRSTTTIGILADPTRQLRDAYSLAKKWSDQYNEYRNPLYGEYRASIPEALYYVAGKQIAEIVGVAESLLNAYEGRTAEGEQLTPPARFVSLRRAKNEAAELVADALGVRAALKVKKVVAPTRNGLRVSPRSMMSLRFLVGI